MAVAGEGGLFCLRVAVGFLHRDCPLHRPLKNKNMSDLSAECNLIFICDPLNLSTNPSPAGILFVLGCLWIFDGVFVLCIVREREGEGERAGRKNPGRKSRTLNSRAHRCLSPPSGAL